MWKRTKQSGTAANSSSDDHRDAAASTMSGPRALSAKADLLLRAAWDGLGEAERASLRSGFSPFPAPASSPVSNGPADIRSSDLQDWVATLVGKSFQKEAAQIIASWLLDSSPDAHLYVGGSIGQGRRSLVASMSRQAMARRPVPPEYCYVPDPGALDQAYLLVLPRGTGKAFAAAIDQALQAITSAWPAASGQDNAPGQQPSTPLGETIAKAFSGLDAASPEAARPYNARLRASFEGLAAKGAELPVSYQDLATWLVRAPGPDSAADAGAGIGAPVVVGTLFQEKLDELLIRANGGVLILPAAELLLVDGSWPGLTAALTTQSHMVKAGWPTVPLDLRVALVGDGAAYNALASAPGEFGRIFRYEAWCNDNASWTKENEAAYAALADGVARRHQVPFFDATGVARLVEEGSRRVDGLNRTHLVTDLLLLHDIALEAGHAAASRGATATGGDDVETVLARRRAQQGTTAERVREAILSGQEITPTSGSAVGQVNGLGIFSYHPPEGDFAVPIRISATVSPGGDERVLDIEQQADQADADHVRGEMTVEGYLAARYGQSHPIDLVARVRFEQAHGTLGGDSASGALLFALLSALSEAPIRYSYAVTGAVGQYGELQPIGGVNTKIEGFFELCRLRRAQGEQPEGGYGVIIPAVNARDLMLRSDIADQIADAGWFHIWPVGTVDEAMTLLTGIPPRDLHARVERRLRQFYEIGARSRAGR